MSERKDVVILTATFLIQIGNMSNVFRCLILLYTTLFSLVSDIILCMLVCVIFEHFYCKYMVSILNTDTDLYS